jgi:hypothetical protein
MEIHRSKVRSGRSYPIHVPALLYALVEASPSTPLVLHLRDEVWWTDGVLFRADFYPPGGSSHAKGETLHMSLRSVASQERAAARAFLEHTVIPQFITWLGAFEALPENSPERRSKQSFARSAPELQ